MIQRLLCFTGFHRHWIPIAPLKTILPDGALSVTWAAMECVYCRKKRYDNYLRPGESVHFQMDLLLSDVEWEQ